MATNRHLSGSDGDKALSDVRSDLQSRAEKMQVLRVAFDKVTEHFSSEGGLSRRILLNVLTADRLREELSEELSYVYWSNPEELREAWEIYYSKEDRPLTELVCFRDNFNEIDICASPEFMEEINIVQEDGKHQALDEEDKQEKEDDYEKDASDDEESETEF
ncbi:hypothetical protein CAPTEDRAFT_198857 [Capitella teleta]|uniref:Uncharacterized protein n=1 Tax=Capitella teleta TaxID=283909 RepID=R7T423_CAPTE|nr:hypothetical protein CAPTEDRAFT_198857 [Capitella teleta]|eukprot:ELT87481.1 hypothetical protein CAPTEDRAFT_198857 [Capitella teleta]